MFLEEDYTDMTVPGIGRSVSESKPGDDENVRMSGSGAVPTSVRRQHSDQPHDSQVLQPSE